MAKEKAQKIPTINKLDNRIVSEHNDLIRSTANMTSLSLKLFEIAVSAMDSREKQPSHEVRINKEQIYNALGIKGTSKNQQLSKALNTLRKSSNFEITTEQNGEIHDIGITPVYYADNNYSSNYAVIRFAPEILPFITDLKKNFTQYQLNDILHLKNKYAVSMYRWFTMNYRQYEYYANSGKRREDQIEKYANPEITLEELRKLTGTEKKYSAFYDVRRYIIDPICNEITKHTKYNVTYDRIKGGRKIVAIKFHISKKGEKTVEDDSVVDVSLNDFLQNRYSQLLIGAGLLDMSKVTSDEKYRGTIVGTLYPAYDKFLKNADITDLDNHLHYVAQNMKQKPDNLARYLAKAIANYSEKRKQQKPKNSKGSANKKSKGTHVEEKKPAWLKATEYLKAQGFSDAEMDNNKRALELLINHFGKDSEQVAWYTHAYKNASKTDIEALRQRIANRKKK
ncbi:RepB family plasmid replication initiator protein [Limosilactobacillus reuteri]|uniref:replication initiation protein n=1 Tax=Limosilactobacillus reuteri TaxID=1598 RepID=UPI001E493EF7|nr:replication initiation protein [Limosilactobacillus reuteri]MCC4414869.1 RepB family plasmid replication initiator protein [Limosilactobacillus reuteri]